MKIKFLARTGKPPVELVDLRSADLSSADLRSADLRSADLRSADLSGANLRSADLLGADLSGANLSGADLSGADLSGADLRGADLRGADLRSANLRSADLRSADLSGANLRGAKGLAQQTIVPQGMLVGYKKLADGSIATLHIPADAKRVNAYGNRKCRADKAYVAECAGEIASKHDSSFLYRTGIVVRPTEPFCDDPRIECASGIHFFITREEAMEY